MKNKICQSCGMSTTSNEQLDINKDGSVFVLLNVLVDIILIVLVKIQNVIAKKKINRRK